MIRAGLGLLLGWGIGIPVWAHGVHLDFTPMDVMEVQARYDTGEPMAGAQVTVFAPGDPQTPWLTGQTDPQGRFWFRPDGEGSWQVRIRQAGHGGIVTIPVDSSSGDPSQAQVPEASHSSAPGIPGGGMRWLMAATWVWGLVGTALFFSRFGRRPPHAPS